ncbi:zinc-dependent alcohol dehydrogenase family protein [Thioalkalivibrio sp. XN8]|uniref:zinc-dependent alcohol dehydrogenase family protein n=1 Tax=Thioalkalivibrio sp. XN8 TaxID=2712863 RepID=UPI0013ED2C29|nr:zinc-dependent alcohol dehydrogenase family protein [Thioalkalivibrio sp. XN8]NGP52585.1 zinc-dependent alcohol dehydrogenase family protein [Thioalkalivibrio sp. XN8]
MKAMVLDAPGRPLVERRRRRRRLQAGEVRVQVAACGVCRTDLHLVDGELPDPCLPVVPGHEIVGTVIEAAADVPLEPGLRVGIPWLGWSCGDCDYCRAGQENLCPEARFTGYQLDGGYAEEAIADARFVFPLPAAYDDLHAAPLLCAGLIGYRTLAKAGAARRLGIYGFGAAAHIVAQVARWQGREICAFTRPGDTAAMDFARTQGACWAGGSDEPAPEPLDAALLFAPVGELVPAALAAVRPGGTVVCGGIHMSDIPAFPYELLWGERVLCSVANLTRADAVDFLALADTIPIQTEVVPYPLARANEALDDLRAGRLQGAAVLVPSHG